MVTTKKSKKTSKRKVRKVVKKKFKKPIKKSKFFGKPISPEQLTKIFTERRKKLSERLLANPRSPPVLVARAVVNAERLKGAERIRRLKELVEEIKLRRIQK